MPLRARLLSINVALPRTVVHAGKPVETGIFKEPVAGAVLIGARGLEGDGQADLTVHGGIHKAVYAYAFAHTLWWREELARADLGYGAFGENLSVDELDERAIHIGDVFRCGEALLQVTQPRAPCFKLGMKLGLPTLPKQFLQSGRTGFYLKTLEPGRARADDTFERVAEDPAGVSVHDVHRLFHFERDDLDGVRRAIEVEALAPEWRDPLRERL